MSAASAGIEASGGGVMARAPSPSPEAAPASPGPLHSSQLREEADNYPRVVAVLSPAWRVIACKGNIQWILQNRKSRKRADGWRGRHFCRTREALLRIASGKDPDPAAMAILAAFPDYFPRHRGGDESR